MIRLRVYSTILTDTVFVVAEYLPVFFENDFVSLNIYFLHDIIAKSCFDVISRTYI